MDLKIAKQKKMKKLKCIETQSICHDRKRKGKEMCIEEEEDKVKVVGDSLTVKLARKLIWLNAHVQI